MTAHSQNPFGVVLVLGVENLTGRATIELVYIPPRPLQESEETKKKKENEVSVAHLLVA